jgi:short-subunit dehydrogenase
MNEKMVLIIGGSSGIGFEVARQARERGARLKDPAKLAIAAERLGGAVKTAVLDAHDDKALENFFVNEDDFDHLVSTIGDSMAGGFLTTTPETMHYVLHSKFWTNWMIGRPAASKLRCGGSIKFTEGLPANLPPTFE